jgi:hypothetical protein
MPVKVHVPPSPDKIAGYSQRPRTAAQFLADRWFIWFELHTGLLIKNQPTI